MGHLHRRDREALARQHLGGFQLHQLQLVAHAASGAQAKRDQLTKPLGTVDPQRPLAPAEVELS